MSVSVLAVAGVLLVAGVCPAAGLSGPKDGRSRYTYDNLYSPPTITEAVDQRTDAVLEGVAAYPDATWKERGVLVFEFEMNSELFGQAEIPASLRFYVTEAGADSEDNGVQLRYSQGNGVVEYGDGHGELLSSVDPMVTGWRSVDVSDAVQAAADGGWSWLCLALYPDDWPYGDAGGDRIHVASSEYTDYEPHVQIAPEPGSGLLLLGVCGLMLSGGRRRGA